MHGTKTEAAHRAVELLPVLRDELLTYAAAVGERDPDGLVFGTSRAGGRYEGGQKHSPSNVRRRVLAQAVEGANAELAMRGEGPLPEGLAPHSLRRTFASVLVALGRDPAVVMRQMGHTPPQMTLGVYAAAMPWTDDERERLRALVEGASLAVKGQTADSERDLAPIESRERRAA